MAARRLRHILAAAGTLAVGIILLGGAVASIARATRSAPAKTVVTIYHPFSARGLILPHVRVVSGYCGGSSSVSLRYDAFRCFAGNFVYDPCFSSPIARAGVVVCPTDPANDDAIAIRLTTGLPASTSHSQPAPTMPPWAVQTAAGMVCFYASGASSIANGIRENYFCGAQGADDGALWGFPSRRTQRWTQLQTRSDATSLAAARRVSLREVWI